MSEPGLIALGRCWACGQSFPFHPDLVPSIPIDRETNRPLDVDAEGRPRRWTAEEYLRAAKQPICRDCVGLANEQRAANGRPLIDVLPGAYPDE